MKKIIFNLILVILLLFIFSIQAFASTPKLVNKVNDAFKEIEEWILKISTLQLWQFVLELLCESLVLVMKKK